MNICARCADILGSPKKMFTQDRNNFLKKVFTWAYGKKTASKDKELIGYADRPHLPSAGLKDI